MAFGFCYLKFKHMDIYREIILDHYKHPRNYGHLEHADVSAEEHNVSCGDRIIMEVNVRKKKIENSKENNDYVIEDIKFSGEGCAIDQASASMLTEEVKGKTVSDVLSIKTDDILDMLGTELTPTRIKCAVLPLEVLQKAVSHL